MEKENKKVTKDEFRDALEKVAGFLHQIPEDFKPEDVDRAWEEFTKFRRTMTVRVGIEKIPSE